jgi:hypothetical protein
MWSRVGRVLVAIACSTLAASCTAEEPATSDRADRIALTIPRAVHKATVLADQRVLVTGGCTLRGCDGFERALASEFFDPATGRFIPGPEMTTPRAGHTATLLRDGRVLLVGGYAGEGRPALATAEVFDPQTDAFRRVGDLAGGRADHSATLLPDGHVLIAGGTSGNRDALSTTELFDPATNAFAPGPSLSAPRSGHAGVVSGDLVVLAGGTEDFVSALATTDVRRGDSWSPGPLMGTPRVKHAAVTLPGGPLLIVGGSIDAEGRMLLDTTEVLDIAAMRAEPGPDLSEGQYKLEGAVTRLADGRIVIAGGQRVDVYDPASGEIATMADPPVPRRSFVSASAVADGVLVAGGYDSGITPTADARIVRIAPAR